MSRDRPIAPGDQPGGTRGGRSNGRHRPGRARRPRAHGRSPRLLIALVLLLLLVIALPLDEWVPVRAPRIEVSLDAGLPPDLAPETRARIVETRAAIRDANLHWEAGYTEVSDLSPAEFQRLLGARPPRDEVRLFAAAEGGAADTADLPARWDWRDLRAVGIAPAQGTCGSCWAFAATGAVEALLRLYDGRSLDLSEQHVLSCNAEGYGCAGGWMTAAYALWNDEGAIREVDMPYEGRDDRPCPDGPRSAVVRVLEWSPVGGTAAELKRMLLVGPLAVAMHVYPDFQHYRGGVYEHAGVDDINHALLLIGWDDSLGAWIVRNSWGRGWGQQGCAYVRYGCCRLGSYAHRVGIPAARPVVIRHAALTDTLAGGGLAIDAFVTAVSAPLASPGLTVWLDVGRGFERTTPDERGATTHEASYRLPLDSLPAGTLVRYWLEGEDAAGHRAAFPDGGASSPIEARLRRIVIADDFEEAPAWTAGVPEDGATGGRWEWGTPESSHSPYAWVVQPGAGHTPGGAFCFVTGLAAGAAQEDGDVDGGRTTLASPPYDLRGFQNVQLRFWLWFNNGTGAAPFEDPFVVEGSADGGARWVELFRTLEGASRWRRVVVDLDGRMELTDRVHFRFVARDSLGDSVVEALVDDVELLAGARESTSVDPTAPPQTFRAIVGPNPARGSATVMLELAREEEVGASVVDATGRCVRTLWRGVLPAGSVPLTWDGRDDRGRHVAAGIYWVELAIGGRREHRRLVFMR